ncbi:hypothetical protein HJG60_008430 [Phyllostomus discolor]|uniref:Uncharacterized protein n=1 Tax=Phyllostomus discolor TaxID=89673 RepID=A0A833Z1K8_9CHIR|nr:hypothetical protein HJG60_008430 [Phyllostomus discolor]
MRKTSRPPPTQGCRQPPRPLPAALPPPPRWAEAGAGRSQHFPTPEGGQPAQETVAGHPGKVAGAPTWDSSPRENRQRDGKGGVGTVGPRDVPGPAGAQRKHSAPCSQDQRPGDMPTAHTSPA